MAVPRDVPQISKSLQNKSLKPENDSTKCFATYTGKPLSQVEKDVDRDYFMDAEEAKKYGVIDKVI